MQQIHPIAPLFDKNSRLLILGSFPSAASREYGFFYGHPKNRFWPVLSAVFHSLLPVSIEDKKEFLYEHKIALWDVIASCEITGSSDNSIRNIIPNDINMILNNCDISRIFTNGRTSEKLFTSHIADKVSCSSVYLPSTSPANAAYSLQRLIDAWVVILNYE